MKKNNLTSSLYAVLMLTGVTVSVWAAQYPAATEPEILYQDTGYITAHSQSDTNTQTESASSEDGGYPVTTQPEVLYQDAEYIASHSSQTESGADSKYPAMHVEPEIIYQDTDYIAKH